MELQKKLTAIQNELKAPKSQYNAFGKYHYRNCEDILEALKPFLLKHDVCLYITDHIVNIGSRFYVKADVTISSGSESITSSSYARESEDKKGMDASQITGSSSSYARKYALNALFLIDDTKDADSQDNTKSVQVHKPATAQVKSKPTKEQVVGFMKATTTLPQLDVVFKQAKTHQWTDEESIYLQEHREAEEARIRNII